MNRIERYRNTAVLTADPAVLVRLLLEETMRTVGVAIDHCKEGRIIERGRAASRAVELLTSLMVNLNTEGSPDVASGLSKLYEYCQYRVIEGHVKGEVKRFEEVLSVLGDITEAWVEVLEREAQDAAAGEGSEAVEEAAEPAWA